MSRGAVTIAAGAAVAGLFLAMPALGDTDLGGSGGVYYETDTAQVTPPNSALVDVDCLPGTQPTGGGFSSGFLNDTAIWSFPLGTAWRVYMYIGTGGQQDATAFVMCKSGKLRYPKREVDVGAGKARLATVGCPGRTHVAGGGAFLEAPPDDGWLNSSFPYDDRDNGHAPDDGWRARVFNGAADSNTMRVVAVCQKHQPRYVHQSATLVPSVSSAAIPACRAADHVIGAGIELSGPASTGLPRVLKPADGTDGNTVPDDKVLANAYNDSSASQSKELTGYAVCQN